MVPAVKWFAAALIAALVLLQYRVWFSADGVGEVLRLRTAVAAQQADNQRLSNRNRQLAAEVRDLKQGYSALEERARSDLGMVGSNETFFQVGPGEAEPRAPSAPGAQSAPLAPRAASAPPTRTAAR
jgi:cell division protein FtsB